MALRIRENAYVSLSDVKRDGSLKHLSAFIHSHVIQNSSVEDKRRYCVKCFSGFALIQWKLMEGQCCVVTNVHLKYILFSAEESHKCLK